MAHEKIYVSVDVVEGRRKRVHSLSPLQRLRGSLPVLAKGILSDDPIAQLEATKKFRKLLVSSEQVPPVELVISAGVVPQFVELLDRHVTPELQFEAACVLTEIAAGTSKHSQVVIEHGAVPKFVRLLSSSSPNIQDQAICALGKLAGDSPTCRDVVLNSNALMPLLAQLNKPANPSILRNATRTLLNFCHRQPLPPFEILKPALPTLQHLIHSIDEEVIATACWVLFYLSVGLDDNTQALIEVDLCPRLVELLHTHTTQKFLIPTLGTVGNIARGADAQAQVLIDNQVLPCLYQLLTQNHNQNIKKLLCFAISNLASWNRSQIQAVIDANIIPYIVHLAQHSDIEIKKEAVWAISNVTFGQSTDQIRYLVAQGCIKPLCDLLPCSDPSTQIACLEGLENILQAGDTNKLIGRVNIYEKMVDDCEGAYKAFQLYMRHNNDSIHEKAEKIVDRYIE